MSTIPNNKQTNKQTKTKSQVIMTMNGGKDDDDDDD